jgi:hypothetical protein
MATGWDEKLLDWTAGPVPMRDFCIPGHGTPSRGALIEAAMGKSCTAVSEEEWSAVLAVTLTLTDSLLLHR